MMHRKGFKFVPGLVLAGAVGAMALGSGGCSAVSNAAQAAQGCDEFSGGVSAVANLSIDANTKAFVTAAAQLQGVATTMETSVLNACIGIATDLGQMDTWTAKGPDGGGSMDDETTEACNQAVAGINAALMAATTAQVTCGLAVSGGECQVNAMAQVSCEGQCNGAATCMMGSIQARCSPAQLTGQCSGTCNASATCEGSATVQANCQGSCSGECTGTCTPPSGGTVDCNGMCSGTCMGTTGAGGMCQGKCAGTCTFMQGSPGSCSGSCKGTCSGSCKLDANAMVNCGANVNCTGGCSVMYTAPQCEGKLTPPMCNIDANCEASCQSQAEFSAMCTPPTVDLTCTGTVTTQITTLIATLKKNLPPIFLAAKTQGQLALDAAGSVATTGKAVVSSAGSLSGKAIACAGVAAKAAVSASASVNVSVMASASVSGSASAGS